MVEAFLYYLTPLLTAITATLALTIRILISHVLIFYTRIIFISARPELHFTIDLGALSIIIGFSPSPQTTNNPIPVPPPTYQS